MVGLVAHHGAARCFESSSRVSMNACLVLCSVGRQSSKSVYGPNFYSVSEQTAEVILLTVESVSIRYTHPRARIQLVQPGTYRTV